MTSLLEKKLQAFESLLLILGEMQSMAQDGDLAALDDIAEHRDKVIGSIKSLDQEATETVQPTESIVRQVEKIMALVRQVSAINDRLISETVMRVRDAGNEIAALHKGAEAVTGYGKIGTLLR